MSSPAKLTDTQRAILFEASKRKDRCLIAPKTLKGAATQKVAAKLLKAGLVSEIKARSGMEIWRRDEETGQAYSLKLTVAGLKAIPADERGSQSIPSTAVSPNTNDNSSKAKTAANMAAARSATESLGEIDLFSPSDLWNWLSKQVQPEQLNETCAHIIRSAMRELARRQSTSPASRVATQT